MCPADTMQRLAEYVSTEWRCGFEFPPHRSYVRFQYMAQCVCFVRFARFATYSRRILALSPHPPCAARLVNIGDFREIVMGAASFPAQPSGGISRTSTNVYEEFAPVIQVAPSSLASTTGRFQFTAPTCPPPPQSAPYGSSFAATYISRAISRITPAHFCRRGMSLSHSTPIIVRRCEPSCTSRSRA